MKEFEIPPFYVGQEIVAIKSHPEGVLKKGQEFKVLETGKTPCCRTPWVYVGHATPKGKVPGTHCAKCDRPNAHRTKLIFPCHWFRPKIQLSDFISMKQLAETQLETIGAN